MNSAAKTPSDTLPIWEVISSHMPHGDLLTIAELGQLCRDAGYGTPHIGGPGPGAWAAIGSGIRERVAVVNEDAQATATQLLVAHQPRDPFGGRSYDIGSWEAPTDSDDMLATLIRTGWIAIVDNRVGQPTPQTTPQGMRYLWGARRAK